MGRPRPFHPPGSGKPSSLQAALGVLGTEGLLAYFVHLRLRQGLWTVSNAKHIPSRLQIMRPRGQGTHSGCSQPGLLTLKAQGSFPASGSAQGSGPEVARHAFLSTNEGRHPCHPTLQESPSSESIRKARELRHTCSTQHEKRPVQASPRWSPCNHDS